MAQNSLGSKIIDFFKQTGEAVIEKGKEVVVSNIVSFFRKTPLGQQIEETATEQKVKELALNPVVIVIVLLVAYLVWKGLKK